MKTFNKGDKVCRHYIAEPTFLYGGDKIKETGEVVADPIEWDGKLWVMVKWKYESIPELELASHLEQDE